MKNAKPKFQREFQNQEARILSGQQLPGIAGEGSSPVPFQQRPLIRIEQTIVWTRHFDGTEDETVRRRVFYRKPLLTHQGKLDKERLCLGILSRRE